MYDKNLVNYLIIIYFIYILNTKEYMTDLSIQSNKRVNTPSQRDTCVAESCAVRTSIPQLYQYKFAEAANQLVAIPIGELHNIPDSTIYNPINNIANWYFRNVSSKYKVVDNLGINTKNARDIDICLAKYAQKVAETMDISNACYTGVKHALWAAGVINDYADMPKGSAYEAKTYFDAHPDKFEKLNISKNDLKNLPAGVIIVYHKEGLDGHIAITNGNGQEMCDSTDNMGWLDEHGEGAEFAAYKLTDNWQYNRDTMKLEFNK